MIHFLESLGQSTQKIIARLGFSALFFLAILRHSGIVFFRPRLLTRQIYDAGVLSIIIIAVSGLFVGLVMGLQIYNTLAVYGSTEMTGALVALIVLRELGPVLTGIFFASRAGSSMTAEIGLMKATEQLDAMAVMAVNPIARVIAPRFWAGVIALPILTALFNVMAIFGTYLICVRLIHMDEGIFWGQIKNVADFRYDVMNSLLKSAIFGIAVSLIAVIEGYDAMPTAQGVSTATTRTVVIAALTILALDFVMTAFLF